jgi:hypothetical protein
VQHDNTFDVLLTCDASYAKHTAVVVQVISAQNPYTLRHKFFLAVLVSLTYDFCFGCSVRFIEKLHYYVAIFFFICRYMARSASNLFSISDYAVAPPDYHRKAL